MAAEDPVPPKRVWTLNQEAFDKLLGWLDSDRGRAGEKYEQVRRKLLKFFTWRECSDPDACADRTIDRVSRRIIEGADLRVTEPYVYFHGVAINVLREHWRERENRPVLLSDQVAAIPAAPATDPTRSERLLGCMQHCLAKLPPESRELVMQYHRGEKRLKIDTRKALAASLQMPLNALRIRVFRLRAGLQACFERCAKSIPE
jgi:DNA-directed RNA polymerase specialized sigma24 family protein